MTKKIVNIWKINEFSKTIIYFGFFRRNYFKLKNYLKIPSIFIYLSLGLLIKSLIPFFVLSYIIVFSTLFFKCEKLVKKKSSALIILWTTQFLFIFSLSYWTFKLYQKYEKSMVVKNMEIQSKTMLSNNIFWTEMTTKIIEISESWSLLLEDYWTKSKNSNSLYQGLNTQANSLFSLQKELISDNTQRKSYVDYFNNNFKNPLNNVNVYYWFDYIVGHKILVNWIGCVENNQIEWTINTTLPIKSDTTHTWSLKLDPVGLWRFVIINNKDYWPFDIGFEWSCLSSEKSYVDDIPYINWINDNFNNYFWRINISWANFWFTYWKSWKGYVNINNNEYWPYWCIWEINISWANFWFTYEKVIQRYWNYFAPTLVEYYANLNWKDYGPFKTFAESLNKIGLIVPNDNLYRKDNWLSWYTVNISWKSFWPFDWFQKPSNFNISGKNYWFIYSMKNNNSKIKLSHLWTKNTSLYYANINWKAYGPFYFWIDNLSISPK